MRKISNLFIVVVIVILASCLESKRTHLCYNSESSIISYGANRLSTLLESTGYTVETCQDNHDITHRIVILTVGEDLDEVEQKLVLSNVSGLKPDGFKIMMEDQVIYVLAKTERGGMYGIMDLVEQLGPLCDFSKIEGVQIDPAFSFRAIKFNLPWSPYRPGPATELHMETCRDLKFWESFLDMMVENRFNALSLWNTHPFPYMIRATNFPKATPLNDQELDEWRTFWQALFKMAKDRGIETYLVNWNIVVSPEFANAYGAKEYDDRSELVRTYTSESVTQLINEYEDLTGLGVTLADWMGNWGDDKMTPTARENWIEDTFVEGMKNADRKIKFIHRAVLAGDPKEMRRVIDHADLPDKTIVEVKFNWSHGHSTPNLSLTHSNDEGAIMKDFWDPKPENYFIAWMIRNEDFFVLRWGDPEFIRDHIQANHLEYVDGYFVGSEGYIPAKDYSHNNHPHKTWKYAFEKQWLFYHLWGRLTYYPEETDATLAKAFEKRYPNVNGLTLLKAYSLASKVPLYLASFYKGTWDFTLYSEGFLAPWQVGFDDQKSPFISIDELIRHETLDSRYLSISKYCQLKNGGLLIKDGSITPLELAQNLQETATNSIAIIDKLRSPENAPALNSELDDLETWCHLGFYIADKIRAGVSLETFRLTGQEQKKQTALEYLLKCVGHWENVILLTEERYKPMPYVSMGHPEPKWPEFNAFHWKFFLKDVEEDIEYVRNER